MDGLSLGVTPALTALLSPAWGRLADRFGRKIMVERSLVSFVVLLAAMAFVTRAGTCWRCALVQGLFAGYGSLSVTMAAESAPRDRMPQAIGAVQTAQRLGPGVGPVIGGVAGRPRRAAAARSSRRGLLAVAPDRGLRALRRARRARHTPAVGPDAGGAVTFRTVLAFRELSSADGR